MKVFAVFITDYNIEDISFIDFNRWMGYGSLGQRLAWISGELPWNYSTYRLLIVLVHRKL